MAESRSRSTENGMGSIEAECVPPVSKLSGIGRITAERVYSSTGRIRRLKRIKVRTLP